MTQIYNFSSGPAMLPVEVMRRAQQELCNWNSLGTSVMEISHRSKEFLEVVKQAEYDLRFLLQIPDNYKVLFLHGGARAQFAALPLNLLGNKRHADYINGGYWAHSAAREAQKYCTPHVIDVKTTVNGTLQAIKPMREWQLTDDAAYVHYCPNETIDGIAIDEVPDFGDKVVIGDFSSTILSRPIDVSRYGVIYAGAQKNIGPAGITLVIIRDDLLGNAKQEIPSILDYTVQSEHGSMFNTPPTFAWYLSGLVFQWLIEQGGLHEIQKMNKKKAQHLYDAIDRSDFYDNQVATANRSYMNVPFRLANSALDKQFLAAAQKAGLHALQGHRVSGGMRASIYNAMPFAGVDALVTFMQDFERRNA